MPTGWVPLHLHICFRGHFDRLKNSRKTARETLQQVAGVSMHRANKTHRAALYLSRLLNQ